MNQDNQGKPLREQTYLRELDNTLSQMSQVESVLCLMITQDGLDVDEISKITHAYYQTARVKVNMMIDVIRLEREARANTVDAQSQQPAIAPIPTMPMISPGGVDNQDDP